MVGVCLLLLGFSFRALAGDLAQAQEQFQTGNYAGCIETLRNSFQDQAGGEERYLLLCKAEMMVGRYRDALKTIREGLEKERESIRLRWEAGYSDTMRALQKRAWDDDCDQLEGVILHEPELDTRSMSE